MLLGYGPSWAMVAIKNQLPSGLILQAHGRVERFIDWKYCEGNAMVKLVESRSYLTKMVYYWKYSIKYRAIWIIFELR